MSAPTSKFSLYFGVFTFFSCAACVIRPFLYTCRDPDTRFVASVRDSKVALPAAVPSMAPMPSDLTAMLTVV